MNTTRRFSLILGAVLALTAIVIFLTYRPQSNAGQTSHLYTGMGDFRRFEVQQMEAQAVVGIGDLRHFEAQAPFALIPITGGSASSLPATGMGVLRRFELQQDSQLNIGMGNLRRFEGGPPSQNSLTPQSSLPVNIADLNRSNHNAKVSSPAEPPLKSPGR